MNAGKYPEHLIAFEFKPVGLNLQPLFQNIQKRFII